MMNLLALEIFLNFTSQRAYVTPFLTLTGSNWNLYKFAFLKYRSKFHQHKLIANWLIGTLARWRQLSISSPVTKTCKFRLGSEIDSQFLTIVKSWLSYHPPIKISCFRKLSSIKFRWINKFIRSSKRVFVFLVFCSRNKVAAAKKREGRSNHVELWILNFTMLDPSFLSALFTPRKQQR